MKSMCPTNSHSIHKAAHSSPQDVCGLKGTQYSVAHDALSCTMVPLSLPLPPSPHNTNKHTQDSKSNDSNIPNASVGKIVDQTLVGASIRQLSVVDEDGGTGGWHCHSKPHSPVELGCTTKDLTPLVENNLEKKGRLKQHHAGAEQGGRTASKT